MISANRIELGAAVTRAAQGLPSRPVQPVYAGMLFTPIPDMGIVQITAGDGEVMFLAACFAKIDGDESFILPGKVITDIFKYLSGETVTITFGGSLATIAAGRASYAFPAVEGDKYPSWAESGTEYLGVVDGAEFADLTRCAVPAASKSDSRPTLRTVALSLADDKLTMVATDSYRMAVVTQQFSPSLVENEPPEQVLVPSWVMERFARVCGDDEVAIGWDRARVVLGTQGLKVVARQIAGKYLDWRKVIAKRDAADLGADAKVLDLIRAVKAAALVAGEAAGIRLEFSEDEHIHIRAEGNGGSCDELIASSYDGDTVSFIIGPQMLLDGLAGCDEEVTFRFSSNPLAPVFMEDEGWFEYFMQPRANIEEQGDQPAQ